MAVCLDCSSLSFQSTLSYSADSLAHSRRISPSNTLHICSESLYRYGNCSTFISGACSAICDRETLAKAIPPYLICSSTSLSEPSFASLSTMMWIRPPVRSCTSSAKPQRYPAPHPGAIDSLRRLCDRCRSRPKFPADASALPFHPSILPSTFPPVKSPSQSLCSYIIFYIFQSSRNIVSFIIDFTSNSMQRILLHVLCKKNHITDISISNAVLEFLSVCPRFKYKMPHKAEPPFCCPQTQSFSRKV